MAFRVFRNSVWDLAQRLRVFRTVASGSPTTDWYLAKKISAWRGTDAAGFWQTVYPDPPAAIVTPAITGTPIPQFTLSLNNYLIWDYSDYRTPDTVAYQWQRSLSYSTGYSDISGATGLAYLVQDSDIDSYIRCKIVGTNERASVEAFSSPILFPVGNPYYTFNFGDSLGVNANAYIMLDPVNGVFPSGTAFTFFLGRILRYFTGGFKHYRIWYKSDASTFRIYHQMYRDDQSVAPATPANEIEIVFTNGSNVVNIFVVNPAGTQYIDTYTAWQSGGFSIKTHPSASYAAGRKFAVTMNPLTAVSATTEAASTSSPSILTGWIPLSGGIDSTDATVTFTGGGASSSPTSPGVNAAFTKSNMFFPSTPTMTDPVYSSSTTATVTWSGSNANSYYLTATPEGSTNPTYAAFFSGATTSATMTGLSRGVIYNVALSPNSRSDFLGQFGFAATKTYKHGLPPGAVQSLAAGTPSQVANTNSNVTWTFSWSAPADNGGFSVSSYEWAVDLDADGAGGFGNSTSTTSTSASVAITAGLQAHVRVRAVTTVGPGAWTQITLNSAPAAPGTPSSGAINSTTAVSRVSWTASATRGSADVKYSVFRGQNANSVNTPRNNTPTSDLFLDDDVSGSGTSYYYRVRPQGTLATNVTVSGPDSATSGELSVTQPTVNCFPLISGTSTQVLVLFSAQLGSGNTPTFNLFRGQNTNPVTGVGSSLVGGNTNANNNLLGISDPSPALNTTYYYKVRLTNSIRTSNVPLDSAVGGPITTPDGTAPSRPGAPTGSATANRLINLSWTASTADENTQVTYQVFRGQGNTADNPIGTTVNNQYQDSYTTRPTSGAFRYRVTPSTAWGGTGQQSPLSANIPAP